MGIIITYLYEFIVKLVHVILTLTKTRSKQTVPPARNPLLLTSATSLAAQIREGKLKSEVVVRTYIERIQEVQPYVNGLAEERFEDALVEAREADNLVTSGKMTAEEMAENYPLLGVPFTVKNIAAVEGMKWNGSCLLLANRKATEDAEIVSQLKRKGGIVLGLSIMPELALNPFADGKLYGRVKNPYDSRLYPGISSSGEGVLNATAATPFGIGNDLAGSLRLPALVCGVFCHRPTAGLFSNHGTFPNVSGKVESYMTFGPICRYAEDLTLIMRTLLGPKAKNMKIGDPVDFSKITFYYTYSFPKHSLIPPVGPEVLCPIQKVINYFKLYYGSPVKYIEIDELSHGLDITSMEMRTGLESTLRKSFKAQEIPNDIKMELLKSFIGKSKLTAASAFSYQIFHLSSLSFRSYQKVQKILTKLKAKLDDILDGNAVLIYPTSIENWMYTEEALLKTFGIIFSSIFSILQVPVAQCPVGTSIEGYPLGLQVISNKLEDNLLLAVSSEIERAFGGWQQPHNSN